MNEIQGKINLAKQKKAAQAQLNQTPDPQNTTELSQDQSAFRQQFGDVIDNKMITSKLDLIKKEQVRNIGPIGYFLGNELDREKSKLIKSFLELDNVYDKFVENPDKLREFSADPYEFIVGNINDEWVRNFWTTREGKEFIKSLNLTIPQARQ